MILVKSLLLPHFLYGDCLNFTSKNTLQVNYNACTRFILSLSRFYFCCFSANIIFFKTVRHVDICYDTVLGIGIKLRMPQSIVSNDNKP